MYQLFAIIINKDSNENSDIPHKNPPTIELANKSKHNNQIINTGKQNNTMDYTDNNMFKSQQRHQIYRNGIIGICSTLSTLLSFFLYALVPVWNLIFLIWIA